MLKEIIISGTTGKLTLPSNHSLNCFFVTKCQNIPVYITLIHKIWKLIHILLRPRIPFELNRLIYFQLKQGSSLFYYIILSMYTSTVKSIFNYLYGTCSEKVIFILK